jgi:hypothetical protein
MSQLFLGGLLLRASGVADSFFFISWKIAIVVAAAFIVSLVIGAVREADDV